MHFSVASATSGRLADSDVRFLEWRTSDVARERAVRHPALDWLLCLVNRNSWAAERWRWWPLLRMPISTASRVRDARGVAVTWSGTVTWPRTADDAHTRQSPLNCEREMIFSSNELRIWNCNSKWEIHETSNYQNVLPAANAEIKCKGFCYFKSWIVRGLGILIISFLWSEINL